MSESKLQPSQFLEAAKHDKTLMQKIVAAKSIDERIEIAHSYGYQFSAAELLAELQQMPEALAEEVNPGVEPRHYLPNDEQYINPT